MRDFDPTASEFITSGYLDNSTRRYDAGSIIGIGASLLGANSASDAASQQAAASQAALNAQKEMFDKQIELNKPFYDTGVAANNRLAQMMGLNGGSGELTKTFGQTDFQGDPGYQFRLGEGLKGVQNSAAARGSLLSGGTLKALQKYGQDFASNEYQNAYNRFNNDQTTQYNRFAGLGGGGQTAANQLSSAAGNYGNAQSGLMTGVGNAQAAGAVGSANALMGGVQNWQNQQNQNRLFGLIGGNQNKWGGGFSGTGGASGDYSQEAWY
jgi:hypothetical protein